MAISDNLMSKVLIFIIFIVWEFVEILEIPFLKKKTVIFKQNTSNQGVLDKTYENRLKVHLRF